METCTLFDLFCDPEKVMGSKDLKVQVKNAALVSRITAQALTTFQEGNLTKFDALVGEEACQFRACRIAMLYAKMQKDPSFRNQINRVISEAEDTGEFCQMQFENIGKKPGKLSLDEFFAIRKLLVDEEVRFIVESFLLTETKKEQRGDTFYSYKNESDFVEGLTPYAESTGLGEFSKGQFKKIGEAAQRQLAFLSIQYGRVCAKEEFKKFLGDEYVGSTKGRVCVPCFYGVDGLLQSMMAKNQKLLVEITLANNERVPLGNKVKVLFGPNTAKTGFEPLLPESQTIGTPVVVFSGNSINEQHKDDTIEAFKMQFKTLDVEEVILMNAAQHRQYPSDIKKDPIEDPRRELLASQAEASGCSQSNMTMFLIDHIYADTLKEKVS